MRITRMIGALLAIFLAFPFLPASADGECPCNNACCACACGQDDARLPCCDQDALTDQSAEQPAQTGVLSGFSFSHSGMSMDSIYMYSVFMTEQEYRADYELYYGRIRFSLYMDEEDVAALSGIVKGLASWDGFDRNNSYVLDGNGFGLYIAYTDGTVISASGNNAFPEGYYNAQSAIRDFFSKLMEKNHISIDF